MQNKFTTKKVADEFGLYSLILFLFALFFIFLEILLKKPFLFILSFIMIIFFFYCFNIYLRYKKGFEGELAVAKGLNALKKKYCIFHDVKLPNNYGNIDHLLIGKNGLFVIETKNLKDTLIKSDGDLWTGYNERVLKSPSLQLKKNIVLLKEFLGKKGQRFWVDGAVVFTDSDVELEIKNAKVPVLRLNELAQWIKTQKAHLLKNNEIKEIKKKIENGAKFLRDVDY